MADVNHVTLIGRLTRDAELKYTTNGYAISNFSLALNRRRKSGDQWIDEANFFDVTLYGKLAESLKAYLLKGKQIAVEGELRQDRWDDQDGKSRSKVVISATNVQLLGSGSGQGGAPSAGGSYAGGNTAGGSYSGNSTGNGGQTASLSPYQSREGYEPAPDTGEEFAEDIPF